MEVHSELVAAGRHLDWSAGQVWGPRIAALPRRPRLHRPPNVGRCLAAAAAAPGLSLGRGVVKAGLVVPTQRGLLSPGGAGGLPTGSCCHITPLSPGRPAPFPVPEPTPLAPREVLPAACPCHFRPRPASLVGAHAVWGPKSTVDRASISPVV
jgi:hypothetical protein